MAAEIFDPTTSFRGVVAAGRRSSLELGRKAAAIAERLGVPYVERRGKSEQALLAEENVRQVYVIDRLGEKLVSRSGSLRFHQNTAARRIKMGKGADPIVRAMEIRPDDRILDATLGLACDSLVVAAHLENGRVTGLESNPFLAELVRNGLREYKFTTNNLRIAAEKIEALAGDCKTFIQACAPGSFDVVYFDPHFERTIESSSSMQLIRSISDPRPLDLQAVELAKKAARRAVVVKSRIGELTDVPFDRVVKFGKLFYGVLKAAGQKD